jgi:hypothetical protein
MMRSILASLTSPPADLHSFAGIVRGASFLSRGATVYFLLSRSAKSDPKFCCVRPNRIDRGRHPVARNERSLTLNDEPASVYVALRQRDLFVPCHECDP